MFVSAFCMGSHDQGRRVSIFHRKERITSRVLWRKLEKNGSAIIVSMSHCRYFLIVLYMCTCITMQCSVCINLYKCFVKDL